VALVSGVDYFQKFWRDVYRSPPSGGEGTSVRERVEQARVV
jgi:hypothetical protein